MLLVKANSTPALSIPPHRQCLFSTLKARNHRSPGLEILLPL
jgi:hypothetical protein